MAKDFYENEIRGRGLTVHRVEFVVWLRVVTGQLLAGTIDCLCRDASGAYTLYDWKRVKELSMSEGGNYGWGRDSDAFKFDRLEEIKLEHYSLQLHLYRVILQRNYGLDIPEKNMYLVLLHPMRMNWGKVRARDRSVEAAALVDNFEPTLKFVAERKATQVQIDAWRNDDPNSADVDSDGTDDAMMAMDIEAIEGAHRNAAAVQALAVGGAQFGTAQGRSVARYQPVSAESATGDAGPAAEFTPASTVAGKRASTAGDRGRVFSVCRRVD